MVLKRTLNGCVPPVQLGAGSVGSLVAREVSCVNGVGVATLVALMKLSFGGGVPKLRWKTAFPKPPPTMKKYGVPAVAAKLTLVPKPELHAPGTSVKGPGGPPLTATSTVK